MQVSPLRIGTRGSRLALWQARYVADRLRPLAGPRAVAVVEIQTAGDRVQDAPLAQVGGEGIFTKEIQRAVLAGSADVAVHSLKDLPTVPVEGLVLAAVPARGPAGDVFLSHRHPRFDALPAGAVVATSSPRRRAQCLFRRADLSVVDVRGNVETRLRKLVEKGFDALILALAGLERLGLAAAVTEVLDPAWMLPAVGQGALGLECRADDPDTLALLEQLNDPPTQACVRAERAFLRAMGGGCQVPVGTVSGLAENTLTLRGAVLNPDGSQRIEGRIEGPGTAAEELGKRLAEELLARGAAKLLAN